MYTVSDLRFAHKVVEEPKEYTNDDISELALLNKRLPAKERAAITGLVQTPMVNFKLTKAQDVESLAKVTSKDELRLQMNCVYHDPKGLVATDAHILVFLKGLGRKDKALTFLGKDKKLWHQKVDAKFVDWERVLPANDNPSQPIAIDSLLSFAAGGCNVRRNVTTIYSLTLVINEIEVFVHPEKLYNALEALAANGANTVTIHNQGNNRALYFVADNGHEALVMPVLREGTRWKFEFCWSQGYVVAASLNQNNK